MTSTDPYAELLQRTINELRELLRKRSEVNGRISKLAATALALSRQVEPAGRYKEELMDLMDELRIVAPRLTDAVKDAMYYASPRKLPADQVKALMELRGFSFSHFSNPLASLHSTLRRLSTQGEVLVERDRGRIVYSWKGPHYGARQSLANMLANGDLQKLMNARIRSSVNSKLEKTSKIRTVR